MKQNKRKRRTVWIAIGATVLMLTMACLILWLMAPGLFTRMYIQQTRKPIRLERGAIGSFPAEHHLDDVPWIATREWYCQANSLAMIAAQQGINEPIGHFCFLTGFTYGAFREPGKWEFLPYTDAEAGFGVAAPYLGLARRYYVTDGPSLYLDAVRYYLAQGYPVRVALNGCMLPEMEPCASGHSEVLVGYDMDGFYYYETVTEPRRLPPGERGIWVSDQTLLDAVADWNRAVSSPWDYALTIFEAGPVEQDMDPIWARNGQLLVGGARYGPRQGADAVEALAAQIEEQWAELDVANIDFGSLRCGVETAAYTRYSNAAYLRTAFAGERNVERAADLFDEAAALYTDVLTVLEDGIVGQSEAEQITSALRDAAALEREIGEILLIKGKVAENIMITTEAFRSNLESYNNAIFPMQIITLIVAIILTYFLFAKLSAKTNNVMKAYLAFTYAWMAVVYYFILAPSSLKPGFPILGIFFAVVALLFAIDILTGKTEFKLPKTRRRKYLTLILIIYALVLYPSMDWVLGHPYPRILLFGVVPCPTTIFAIALLAGAIPKVDKKVFALLLLPALGFGFLGPIQHGFYVDFVLLASGIYGLVMLAKNWKLVDK